MTVALIVSLLTGVAWLVVSFMSLMLLAVCIPLRVAGRVDDIDIDELTPWQFDGTGWNAEMTWLFGLIRFRTRGGPGQETVQQLRMFVFTRNVGQRAAGAERKRGTVEQEQSKAPGEKSARRVRRRTFARRPRRDRDQQHDSGDRQRPRRRRTKLPSVGLVRAAVSELPWFVRRLWHTISMRIKGDLVYGLFDPAMTGLSQALLATLPAPAELKLTPDFGYARLNGWVEGSVTVYPSKMIVVGMQAMLRPAIRRQWWSHLRAKLRLPKKTLSRAM